MSTTESNRPNVTTEKAPAYELDQAGLQAYMEQLRSEQNLLAGILGGLAGAIIGAIAWSAITVLTETEFALVAILIGFLVGFGVRKLGRGLDKSFGIAGALLALVGCVVGKFLTIGIFIAEAQEVAYLDVLLGLVLNPAIVVEVFAATFHPLDLLFYGLALYEGYKFAFRTISEEELKSFVRPVASAPAPAQQPVNS